MNSLVGVGGATAGPRRSPQPRASSPCVGRDEELRRLTAALTCAAEGRGAAVFLMGEPGVGKTRLAREALAVARACGFTVVEGRAFPNECGLAYAPVLDAFGPFLRKLDSDRLGRLVRGLADLGRLFSTLGLPAPEPVGDPGLEKTRLFEAMARFVERIAQETPVAIFIDDLQWADVATIDMLHYLGRGLGDQRVLLLASQPNDVFDSSPGLRAMRRSLERAKLGEEIVVPPLGQDAVEGLARSVLEGNAPENLLALLDTWAGGIPLFVEALLGALIDSANLVRRNGRWVLNAEGAPALPPDLRRLVLGCLERLAPIDRRILDLIASLGNPITHILEIASGMEEQALFNGLARLRSAGLVTEGVDGLEVTYRIALPLVQKVVCAELPEILRLRGRTVATEANESTTDGRRDDRKCPNTHHDGASPESKGDLAEAAPLAAGDLATLPSTYVPAMEADDSGSAPVHEGFDRDRSVAGSDKPVLPSSLEHLGEGWESFGEVDAAIAAWSEALTERERVGDAQSVYRLRRRLTIAEWNRGNFEIADLHHKAAIAALASRESLTESTELRFERFRILLSLGDAAGLADMVAEFQSLAQQLASPQAQAEANLATSNFRLWQGDIANARELALNAAIAGEQTQDPVICSRAYTTLVVIGMRLGDHNFMRFHAERGLSVAQRLGAPYSEWGVFHRFHLASAKFMFGAWDESLEDISEAMKLAHRIGHSHGLASLLAARTMVAVLRGDFSRAEASICEAKTASHTRRTGDRRVFGLVDVAEVALALERGQVERALGIAVDFVRTSAWVAPRASLALGCIPMGLMWLAEAQVAAGQPQSALETARLILGLGPTGAPYLTALSSRAEGLARQALGEWQDAIVCLSRSQETFADLAMPFEAAKSLFEEATAAAAWRPDLASGAAQQSLVMFERLGAQHYIAAALRLLQRLALSKPATGRPCLAGVIVSGRELEIAQLVAEGLTDVQIAHRLTLSPLTVSTYLRNLYARVGIGSRAALARLVAEAGHLSG